MVKQPNSTEVATNASSGMLGSINATAAISGAVDTPEKKPKPRRYPRRCCVSPCPREVRSRRMQPSDARAHSRPDWCSIGDTCAAYAPTPAASIASAKLLRDG